MDKRLKEIIIYGLLLINAFVSIFIVFQKYRDYYEIYNFAFWMLIFIVTLILYGIDLSRQKLKVTAIQTIIISILIYTIISYGLGVFVGFKKSPLATNIIKMIQNIIIFGSIIVMQEYIRFSINKNSNQKAFNYIISVVIFSYVLLSYELFNTNFSSGVSVLKLIGLGFLPTMSCNVLFTYLNYKKVILASIIYRLVFELRIYYSPIIPDINEYVEAIVKFAFPIVILLVLIAIYSKATRQREKINTKAGFFTIAFTLVVAGFLATLVLGIGKYQMIAIISNSMYPTFQRGDAVILEKLNDKEIKNLKVDDVLLFREGDVIVVHRIAEINDYDDVLDIKIITKGDNNLEIDKNEVTINNIIGKTRIYIPKIGYPSIWLQEMLSE